MTRPATTAFGEDVYGQLAPVATQDEGLSWPLLIYVMALAQMFVQPEAVVRATDEDHPAWSQALDPDRTPAFLLPWLGQFVGVLVTLGATEAVQRQQIDELNTLKRGRVDTLAAAVAATLTGTKSVRIDERKGASVAFFASWDAQTGTWDSFGATTWDAVGTTNTQAFSITVTVKATECPDVAATTAAAERAKMSGLLLTLVVDGEYSWDQEAGTWDAAGSTTWDQAATVPL